jgi:hypothetical protein
MALRQGKKNLFLPQPDEAIGSCKENGKWRIFLRSLREKH